MYVRILCLCVATLLVPVTAVSQQSEPPVEVQKTKLKALAGMDGVWRGPAWIVLPSGERQELTQTERVGPFLDGAVKVIEGRGYDSEGNVVFNALAVISYDVKKEQLQMRSYADGRVGDFVFKVTDDGYTWEIPAGPVTIRYSATLKDGKWSEYGERVVPGKKPVRFFEMTLARIGDSAWPAADAVPPK